jgi:hypothetical protein
MMPKLYLSSVNIQNLQRDGMVLIYKPIKTWKSRMLWSNQKHLREKDNHSNGKLSILTKLQSNLLKDLVKNSVIRLVDHSILDQDYQDTELPKQFQLL